MLIQINIPPEPEEHPKNLIYFYLEAGSIICPVLWCKTQIEAGKEITTWKLDNALFSLRVTHAFLTYIHTKQQYFLKLHKGGMDIVTFEADLFPSSSNRITIRELKDFPSIYQEKEIVVWR